MRMADWAVRVRVLVGVDRVAYSLESFLGKDY